MRESPLTVTFIVRFTFVALLSLGAVPGIPGFDLPLVESTPRETRAYAGALVQHPALPHRQAQAEQATTDLVAAPSLWPTGRHSARPATLLKTAFGPSIPPPFGLTIASGSGSSAQALAVLIAPPRLSALGLLNVRALRAPPAA